MSIYRRSLNPQMIKGHLFDTLTETYSPVKSSGSFGSIGHPRKFHCRAFSVGSRPHSGHHQRKTSATVTKSWPPSQRNGMEEMMVDEENEQLMREVVQKSGLCGNVSSVSNSIPSSSDRDTLRSQGRKDSNSRMDSDEEEELVVDDDNRNEYNQDGIESGLIQPSPTDGQGHRNDGEKEESNERRMEALSSQSRRERRE